MVANNENVDHEISNKNEESGTSTRVQTLHATPDACNLDEFHGLRASRQKRVATLTSIKCFARSTKRALAKDLGI